MLGENDKLTSFGPLELHLKSKGDKAPLQCHTMISRTYVHI